MFELRDLEYFLAIVEHNSFHRAAKHLNMAQPPLSRRIAALERELGGALFLRESPQIKLTETGRVFADEARIILNRAQLAKRVVQDLGRGFNSHIRLAYVDAAGYNIVPNAIKSFRSKFPRSNVTLTEMRSRLQGDALRAGTIDVGLHRGTPSAEGLAVQRVRSDRLVAVLPASHRLAASQTLRVEDLANEPFVAVSAQAPGGVPDLVRVLCARAGFVPDLTQEVDNVSVLLSCVEAGMGVAITDESVQALPFQRVVYRHMTPPTPLVDMNILARAGDTHPLLTPFITHLTEAARAAP